MVTGLDQCVEEYRQEYTYYQMVCTHGAELQGADDGPTGVLVPEGRYQTIGKDSKSPLK